MAGEGFPGDSYAGGKAQVPQRILAAAVGDRPDENRISHRNFGMETQKKHIAWICCKLSVFCMVEL